MEHAQKMEGDQRKRSKTAKQTQRKPKSREEKQSVELSETAQPSSGASIQDHDSSRQRRPPTSAPAAPRTRQAGGRKAPIITAASRPRTRVVTAGTAQASPLSGTRKVVSPIGRDGKKHVQETLKVAGPPRRHCRPVQRGALSGTTTTPPATGTVIDRQKEEQAVAKVEEKKLLTVSDSTSMQSHSTVATAPKSGGATAEAVREEKHGKETQQEYKSAAQETQLTHGAGGAPDGSDHTPSKKPAQRKRHKRIGRYGE